ncbi:MAG: B12-binding domain-containing radical SAM protein [Treponema sp.]|nr:B12-binding domain-containing radical SAM protein [Treponema sp.]
MKILLVSVNASYMHTNIAIRDLKNYADCFFEDRNDRPMIELAEYTINQPIGEVLRSIAFTGSDWILFSTYIWNAEYVCKLLPEIKKLLPDCLLGAGGPEFGYGAKKYLTNIPALDFIIFGEGEITFTQLLEEGLSSAQGKVPELKTIKGLYYRRNDKENDDLEYSGNRACIEKLDDIPFPYPEIVNGQADPDHKIYYYESSRGCPFGCSYCLSSVDKSVRFKSLERTCQELQIFLDHNIKLVKFVDRTYNLNEEHYLGIWEYILKHHNGKTMFHFEIEAEYLSDKALEFLQQIPEGMMQFEMGVQSANKKTLAAINRSTNVEKLAEKITKIPRTIHQHLDLIAGLPYEDLESFGKSFDFVMELRPDALQLGFLKILNGTLMEKYARENGWKWMETPVYETFSTPYMSFNDIAFLKDVEVLTDAFWNKGTFAFTMNYIFRVTSPWGFLCGLLEYGRSKGAFSQARRESYWFELMNDFIQPEKDSSRNGSSGNDSSGNGSLGNRPALDKIIDRSLIYDLLRYDFVRAGKKGNFPAWYKHNYDKDKHRKLLDQAGLLGNSRIGFSITEYEEFDYDVKSDRPEDFKGHWEVLVRYK